MNENEELVNNDNETQFSILNEQERDLITAAHTNSLLELENEQLKADKRDLLEKFQQKIHEMEMEQKVLKAKLTATEHDYEEQMSELKTTISGLHHDIRKQIKITRENELTSTNAISYLQEHNSLLENKLVDSFGENKILKNELEIKMTLLHDSTKQLETLRQELDSILEEKKELEQRLFLMIEERDLLFKTLNDSRARITQLEIDSQRQNQFIHHQDMEIRNLEETAANLQERLRQLSYNDKPTKTSKPTTSLFAELSECDKSISLMPSTSSVIALEPTKASEFDEINMDDEEFLRYVNSLDKMVTSSYDFSQIAALREPQPSTSYDKPISSDNLMEGLRCEVIDVYTQLQQMWMEVSSRSNGRTGYDTPDELAMVEMNWRIGALRDVLGDLRGLLTDLIETGNVSSQSVQSVNQLQDLQTDYLSEYTQAESTLHELCSINSQLSDTSRLMLLASSSEIPHKFSDEPSPNGHTEISETVGIISSRRNTLISRQNDLRSRLSDYQSHLNTIQTEINQLASESQVTLPYLPNFEEHCHILESINLDEDEKYEFEAPRS